MLKSNHRFTSALPGDAVIENYPRQVQKACYSFVKPKTFLRPKLIHASEEVAALLGLNPSQLSTDEFLQIFSGNKIIDQAKPFAMCYGGHQFGHWAGQLGDGRAINIGEVEYENKSWTLQLKGAGPTPYSRTADGFAVLRSSIREHLCSEAMHYLGVPTTRSLSLMLTGEEVLRDIMYDGNPDNEKGAVVCRVSESFIRFGNFEILASRNDMESLRLLVDFTIQEHFKAIQSSGKERYIAFFNEVMERTLDMVIHWQRVGFVHGVMNTDNMSILGQTIDYGPYGWLEGFDPNWTPNTTDRQGKRYRYGHQPQIALWNLIRLANALYPLIEDAKPFEEILNKYPVEFEKKSADMMRHKLGLQQKETSDVDLINDLFSVLQLTETDMTIFFRNLALGKKDESPDGFIKSIKLVDSFYQKDDLPGTVNEKWKAFISEYINRLNLEAQEDEARSKQMNTTNPKYVLRNYMAQLAIDEADKGDYGLVNELHELLKMPYAEQDESVKWFAKRPEWARHKVGCSMLSCSS